MCAASARTPELILHEAFVPSSAAISIAPVTVETVQAEFDAWQDEPIALNRTRKSRSNSKFLHKNADILFRRV